MRKIALLYWCLISIIAYLWILKIFDHFYEAHLPDKIGLLALSVAWSLLLIKFQKPIIGIWKFAFLIVALGLPLALYPTIFELILYTRLSWLIAPIFLLLIIYSTYCLLESRMLFLSSSGLILSLILPYSFDQDQRKYYDRLEVSIQTREGDIQIAKWKNNKWLYYNGQLQFSTLDRHMYQESFVRPTLQLLADSANVLLIGGDNGLVEDELSKASDHISLTQLPFDSVFAKAMRNLNSFSLNIVENKFVSASEPFRFLSENPESYDAILIDLPDPTNLNYQQYYLSNFYRLCKSSLKAEGFIITQSGDIYKRPGQFEAIREAIAQVGLNVLSYHNQIPTLGQWSWTIGHKSKLEKKIKSELLKNQRNNPPGKWWNQEAMEMMLSFGKPMFKPELIP